MSAPSLTASATTHKKPSHVHCRAGPVGHTIKRLASGFSVKLSTSFSNAPRLGLERTAAPDLRRCPAEVPWFARAGGGKASEWHGSRTTDTMGGRVLRVETHSCRSEPFSIGAMLRFPVQESGGGALTQLSIHAVPVRPRGGAGRAAGRGGAAAGLPAHGTHRVEERTTRCVYTANGSL